VDFVIGAETCKAELDSPLPAEGVGLVIIVASTGCEFVKNGDWLRPTPGNLNVLAVVAGASPHFSQTLTASIE
jgi:hypothetical protein